jgi:Arc/MetJ family transcription regulator
MIKRTTIEIDQELLERARRALGERSTRATVEEALRRAADEVGEQQKQRASNQRKYLKRLATRVDVSVMMSEEMWR